MQSLTQDHLKNDFIFILQSLFIDSVSYRFFILWLLFAFFQANTIQAENNNSNYSIFDTSAINVSNINLPEVTAFAIPPSCTNGTINNDGYLTITAATDATAYNYIIGSDYTSGDFDIANATDIGTLPLQFGALTNPIGSQDYTIRVFNGTSDCYADYTVTMEEQNCIPDCDCTDMLYINEPGMGSVYKFSVDPSSGELTPITSPWYGGNELPSPHGLGFDLNGFLYIGDSPASNGLIRKFNCDGEIFDEADFAYPQGGQFNIGSYNDILYMNDATGFPNYGIKAYHPCSDSVVDSLTFCESGTGDFDYDWGLHIDQNTATGYAVNMFFQGAIREYYLHIFDVSNPNLSATCSTAALEITEFPYAANWDIYGVTTDLSGNIYMVLTESGLPGASLISKYDANLNHIEFSAIDNIQGDGGYAFSAGLVYSATADRLYLASQAETESCVTSFSTDLTIIEEEVGPAATTGSYFKGMGIKKECCPSPARQTIDEILCGATVGEIFFLNEVFPCTGVVCGTAWIPNVGNTGMTYDACNQSITITGGAACGSFRKQGANDQCGAYDLTFNLEVLDIIAPIISGDIPTCANSNDPGVFTTTTATSSSAAITYRWQNSTTNCVTGFIDIIGAPTDTTPYDPPVLSQETYYRLITEVNGVCTSGMCADTSNCITLTPIVFPSLSLASSPSNPTACGICDGSISLRFDNVPAGMYSVNYKDSTGVLQTIENVNIATDSAAFSNISGLCAGAYNDLTITVAGCTSAENVSTNLTEICAYDFGDLPESGTAIYATTTANNGPSHLIIAGLSIGSTVDDEPDGQGSLDAEGDGVDEDGFTLLHNSNLNFVQGGVINIPINIMNTTGTIAHIEAWIDWNGDGYFAVEEEIINTSDDGTGDFGTNFFTVNIPSTGVVVEQDIGVRFRLSHVDNMTPYGVVSSGEIEDYLIFIDCLPSSCLPVQLTVRRTSN